MRLKRIEPVDQARRGSAKPQNRRKRPRLNSRAAGAGVPTCGWHSSTCSTAPGTRLHGSPLDNSRQCALGYFFAGNTSYSHLLSYRQPPKIVHYSRRLYAGNTSSYTALSTNHRLSPPFVASRNSLIQTNLPHDPSGSFSLRRSTTPSPHQQSAAGAVRTPTSQREFRSLAYL